MNKLLCVLVACFAVAASLITNECPPRESLRCFCRAKPQGSQIYCHSISSLEELQGKLKSLEDYAVDFLELKYLYTALSADLFKGLHIKSLRLFSGELPEESPFLPDLGLDSSVEKLDIAYIHHHGNKSITNFNLDHYQTLKEIVIDTSRVIEVGNDWFANGPKNLISLTIHRTELETLGDRAFSSLTNLRSLDVSVNKLKEIPRSVLPSPATHLEKLDISSNKLTSLPSDFFSGMPSLKKVDIELNDIATLPVGTWSPIFSNLEKLHAGYDLNCDEDLKWICEEIDHVQIEGYCPHHDYYPVTYTSIKKFCKTS